VEAERRIAPVAVRTASSDALRDEQARRGPAWLGIGAQRSGTTWFTDLLVQHPEVHLSRRRTKELHRLYRTLYKPLDAERYLRLFDGPGCPGEFTPFYLRALWVPALARQVVGDRAPLIVLLRDPIDRFESAMRMTLADPAHRRRRKGARNAVRRGLASREGGARQRSPSNRLMRWRASDAEWAGMYATQLDCWASYFPREQFVVLQYEAVKRDPQAAVDAVWARMELSPVELRDEDASSETRTRGLVEWAWPDGAKDALTRAYEPDVARLASAWGIDRSLWRNF